MKSRQVKPTRFKNGRYYVRVKNEDGKRSWRGLDTTDPAVAEYRARTATYTRTIEVRGVVEAFLASKKTRVRPITLETYRSALAMLPEGSIKDILPDVLEVILQRSTACAATKNKWLRVWRGFFAWAARDGYHCSNPAAMVDKFRATREEPRFLTAEEEARLLAACDGVDWGLGKIVRAALWSGLRRGTLEQVTGEHVTGAAWTIPGNLMKSGRAFKAPILPELLVHIPTRPVKCEVLFGKLDYSQWVKATEAAGLPGLKFHDLRRTFLVRCRQAGVPLEVAMKLGDWTSAQVVMAFYRAVTQEELVQGLDKAFNGGKGPAPEYAI